MARHDAPAAPARFVGRKLRAGRQPANEASPSAEKNKGAGFNYEKLRGFRQRRHVCSGACDIVQLASHWLEDCMYRRSTDP